MPQNRTKYYGCHIIKQNGHEKNIKMDITDPTEVKSLLLNFLTKKDCNNFIAQIQQFRKMNEKEFLKKFGDKTQIFQFGKKHNPLWIKDINKIQKLYKQRNFKYEDHQPFINYITNIFLKKQQEKRNKLLIQLQKKEQQEKLKIQKRRLKNKKKRIKAKYIKNNAIQSNSLNSQPKKTQQKQILTDNIEIIQINEVKQLSKNEQKNDEKEQLKSTSSLQTKIQSLSFQEEQMQQVISQKNNQQQKYIQSIKLEDKQTKTLQNIQNMLQTQKLYEQIDKPYYLANFSNIFNNSLQKIISKSIKSNQIKYKIFEYIYSYLKYYLPSIQIYLYGSLASRTSLYDSDIDILVQFPHLVFNEYVFDQLKEFIQKLLNPEQIIAIYSAKIPIIKIKLKQSIFNNQQLEYINIDFCFQKQNIPIGQSSGIQSTNFMFYQLAYYGQIYNTFIMLKYMVNKYELNQTYKGGFNGYSLFLMLRCFIEQNRRYLEGNSASYIFYKFIIFYTNKFQKYKDVIIKYHYLSKCVFSSFQIHQLFKYSFDSQSFKLKIVNPLNGQFLKCSFKQIRQFLDIFQKIIILNQNLVNQLPDKAKQKFKNNNKYIKKMQKHQDYIDMADFFN